MKQYGLIGYPLSHSFSKGYFEQKFDIEKIKDCHYENFPLENIDSFKHLIENRENLKGLNVTIPHKEAVIPFLDKLSKEAKKIKAVNTIQFKKGKLIGHNTDVYGFEHSLLPFIHDRKDIRALILGTGGASKAIAFVLKKLNIRFKYVSRRKGKKTIPYSALSKKDVAKHHLIINTTPLGMFPKIQECPDLPYKAVSTEHILYDLVYNPQETLFLSKGRERGADTKNGLEMLHLQAEKAWQIWNKK